MKRPVIVNLFNLFPLFSLFVSLSSAAQPRIKHDLIKGTSDTVFYTDDERIYVSAGSSSGSGRNRVSTVGDYLKTSVLKYSTGLVLQFSIQTGRTNSFSIYKGHYAKLFMDDGSTVELFSRSDYAARKSSLGYGCWIFSYYSLSPSVIQALKNGSVSSIRIETSMGTFDYPIKTKHAKTISEQVSVISK